MRSIVRRMGNSSGVIIPKPLLAELGMQAGDDIDIGLRDGSIVIALVKKHPREGWSEAAKGIAAAGEDAMVLGEFGNAGDDELAW